MTSDASPPDDGVPVDLVGKRMSGRLLARFGIDVDTSPTVSFTATDPIAVNGVGYKWGGMTLSHRNGVFLRVSGPHFLIRNTSRRTDPTDAAKTAVEHWAIATATRLREEHSDQFVSARHVRAADYTDVAGNLRHAAAVLDRFSAAAFELDQPGATIRAPLPDEPSRIAWPAIRDTAVPHSDHIQGSRPAEVVGVAQTADGVPIAYLVKVHRPHRNGGADTPLAVPIDLAVAAEAWENARTGRNARH